MTTNLATTYTEAMAETPTAVLVLLIMITSARHSYAQRIDYAEVYPTAPKEGDSVTFNCISFRAYRGELELVWSKDGNKLTRNDVFVDEHRTDTRIELDYGHLYLTVGNVSRNDSGIYTCGLYKSDLVVDEWSNFNVDVLYYPSIEFPMCSIKSSQTSTNFICSSETGNPSVSLQWTKSKIMADYLPVLQEADGHMKSEFEVTNSHIKSTDVFTCTVDSSEFPESRSCSLYGFDIFRADVLPSLLAAQTSGTAEFTCQTNIEPIILFWKSEPQIPKSRQRTSASQLRIEPVLTEDNDVLISCYALFEGHWIQADAELEVLSHNRGTPITNTDSLIATTLTMNTAGDLRPSGSRISRQGNSNIPWIAVFVIAFIALLMSVTLNIVCYRTNKNNLPEIFPQKSAPEDPKGHQDTKLEETKGEEEYTDLNFGKDKSEDYTGLNVRPMSARYVNNGYPQNKKAGNADVELYDYPEQEDSKRDEDVYESVNV